MAEDQPIDFDKEMVGTVAVPEADQLDLAALTAWFEANVDGFSGPISYTKFKGGQSLTGGPCGTARCPTTRPRNAARSTMR
jgi:hypothetical protein